MKTVRALLMAAAGLFLLVQPVVSHAANVLVDFAANYSDTTALPTPISSNLNPSEVTQATGPLSGSLNANNNYAQANFTLSVASVPEPSRVLLAALGLAGIILRRRR